MYILHTVNEIHKNTCYEYEPLSYGVLHSWKYENIYEVFTILSGSAVEM